MVTEVTCNGCYICVYSLEYLSWQVPLHSDTKSLSSKPYIVVDYGQVCCFFKQLLGKIEVTEIT